MSDNSTDDPGRPEGDQPAAISTAPTVEQLAASTAALEERLATLVAELRRHISLRLPTPVEPAAEPVPDDTV